MNSTGPLFVSKMYKKYVSENGPIPNMHIMTRKEYAGDCNVCRLSTCSGGQYFYHVDGNSWHNWDSTMYNVLLCHWMKIVVLLLVSFTVVFYYRKSQRK
jgi:mannosyltransferase OCH1-like enzyme